ncbi:MAG TPA: oligosaccharide flippase family protein [Chloroflexia bacterium]|nr:oligosaccharide flippase family protein [Chloroflexia bacterium]
MAGDLLNTLPSDGFPTTSTSSTTPPASSTSPSTTTLGGENSERPIQSGAMRNAAVMVAASIVIAVLNYALNIIIGWALPLDEYGRVGVSQTLIMICVWFLGAGFPWVVSRIVARAGGAGPLDGSLGAEAWRTYKTAWVANVLLTVAVVTLLLAVSWAWWLPTNPAYTPLILMVAATVGALGTGAVPHAALQGLFRFGRVAFTRVAEAVVNIVASVGMLALGWGAAGALGGVAVAAAVQCSVSIWYMRDVRFRLARGWGGVGSVRDALPITLAVLGGVLLTNIDLLAIKFLSVPGSSDALSGTYQVAAVLARAPFYIASALVTTFYPRIAQHGPGGRIVGTDLLRWLGLVVLPMNVIMSAGSPAVVAFFFPQRYASAAASLTILGIGSSFLVMAVALVAILQATNRTRGAAVIMSSAVAVQIVGLALLVPPFGAVGAATASALAGSAAFILLAAHVGKDIAPGTTWRQLATLAGLALLILPLSLLGAAQSGRLLVAVWVATASLLYLAACFALNVVDASSLSIPPGLRQTRGVGTIAERALAAAGLLNRLGR